MPDKPLGPIRMWLPVALIAVWLALFALWIFIMMS